MVKQQDIAVSFPQDEKSNKRKKSDEVTLESVASLRKKPRNRVSFSCGECHRRKQKCDRQVPCGHCVSRKVPELCKAYTPGKSEQDMHLRLSRLEQIVEKALPHYASAIPSLANGDDMRDRSPSTGPGDGDDDELLTDNRLQSGAWHGVTALGSVSSGPILEQLQTLVPHQRLTSETEIRDSISHLARLSSCTQELAIAAEHLNAARAGDTASLLAATKIIDAVRQFADPTQGGLNPAGAAGLALPTVLEDTSVADRFKSLVQDCGVSPHKVSELLQELPSKRHSDALVDFYFSSINYTRYPLNEQDFRASYDAICAIDGIGINPSDIKFLPLVFIVLAIAVRVAPLSLTGDDKHKRLISLRYYWSSRRSLLFSAAIHNDSIELVWVRLLSARFLTFDRRITESWSQLGAAVRTAQALGLHRDGKRLGLDNIQTQKRRRLWAYVYHADRSFALVMGRPQCIMDDYTSTSPPLNIEDEELFANPSDPPDHPLTHITPMTFVILRHQLAHIIGKICHHFQQVLHRSHYSEVIGLDEELTRFITSLPAHFSLEPDESLDETCPYIPAHRFIVLTEVQFVRMSLHRPYILRRLDSDRFARSRRACFNAAKTDFALRTEFRQKYPQTVKAMGVAYREFQTAMISGIALMLDPHGPDTPDMKAILDTFLSDHHGLVDLDDTTKRELKIIEFLKSKSLAPRGLTSENGYSRDEPQLGVTGPPISSLRLSQPDAPDVSMHGTEESSGRRPHTLSSPTISRLQYAERAMESPPAASASPSDEVSIAQSLLDHWCDPVSNSPPQDVFGGFSGGPSVATWIPTVEYGEGMGTVSTAINAPDGIEEADLTYWQTMFNLLPKQ